MISGFLIGGLMSQSFGWRAALFAVGFPGVLLAAFMFYFLREPVRGATNVSPGIPKDAPSGVFPAAGYMFRSPAIRQLLIASTLTGMTPYGASTWLPTFFIRVHDLSQSQVGLLMALLFGGLGAAGTFVGGRLFDRLSERGFERGLAMIAVVQVATVPFSVAAYLAGSFIAAVVLFLLPAFAANFFLGPTLALIQTLSPVPMRAVAAAIKMFCLNLVGMSLGPFLVGALSDWLQPALDERSLGLALAILTSMSLWSAGHFWLCGRAMQSARMNGDHQHG